MHFVPQGLIRDKSVPIGVELQKYYFLPDIRFLQEQANEARSLGIAAAEEWYKGLSAQGQQAQSDAARFEQWELAKGLAGAKTNMFNQKVVSGVENDVARPPATLPSRPPMTAATLPIGNQSMLSATTLPPIRQYGVPPGLEMPYSMPPMQSDSASLGSQKSTGTHKASKGSRERARIRSYKKAEIIARCSRLNPPISRDMLERLDAFDAALHVPMPLNESSWDTLRGRLIQQSQKTVLEDEAKSAVRTAPIPGQFRPPSHSDDYMLAHAETSRREKLCSIAEEFIKQKYGYGAWVTFPTSPQFAADVLIHTRQRFVEEEARIRSLQAQTGTITFEESLKLEDMKWVFEQTVKPRTEQIRKNLFVCPECPVQGNVKHFAFESIIQHYASKHTTAFSVGNQKVSWKADWPEIPPFNAHPERVHTPTPSITHTPTLSHQPLSAMSPGSIMTSTIPSAGWRSPDTMSLMSSTTNTYSIAGSSTKRHVLPASAPGYGMYEAQRDMLCSELLRGWRQIPSGLPMPDCLRLYAAISAATSKFNKEYKNQASLDLFSDCINTKAELRDLQQIDRLRCAECIITGNAHSRAAWSLQDMLIHFRKAHLDQNPAPSKPDWKNDMIALPEPMTIKSLQTHPLVPEELAGLLQDAVTTSTLKSVQADIPVLDLAPRNYSTRLQAHGRDNRSAFYDDHQYYALGAGNIPSDNAYDARKVQYPPRFVSSVAATYGDGGSARDSLSFTSRTLKDEELSERDIRLRPTFDTYDQRSRFAEPMASAVTALPPEASVRARRYDVNLAHTRGEAMSRSETVRSYHSRSEKQAASAADDFLSTIDAHVDVEMAEPSGGPSRSARTSRPVSRSNSANGSNVMATRGEWSGFDNHQMADVSRAPFTPVEQAAAPAFHPRSFTDSLPRNTRGAGPETMERQPSNVVEFDHNGTPVPRSGMIYRETSPPQRVLTRPRSDTYGRPLDHMAYHRAVPLVHQEESTGRIRYANDRTYSEIPYQAVEYISAPTYRAERIYDAATGQSYVAEPPRTRQYVQFNDRHSHVQTMYDERGRMVQYRELEPGPDRRDQSDYERYPLDYEDHRYNGR